MAVLSLLGAGWLALHHPLSPLVAMMAVMLLAAASMRWPDRWPLWLLPLLPLAGLYTWTGWLIFEEFDLLVLATATGLYLRAGIWPNARHAPVQWLGWLGLSLYGACLAASVARGWGAAVATAPAWWQGYHEPWNALRVAKAVVWAALLLPAALHALGTDAKAFSHRLVHGMAGMLAVVALLAIWERWAFTGLLNFSTDYRTTALFWEMHVGGAALDGALALSAAFAGAALLTATHTRAWAAWLVTAALVAYASVTTFSRIVYLAVPLTLGLWMLWDKPTLSRNTTSPASTPRIGVIALTVGFLAGGLWLFPSAGYRGLLALWMCCALLPSLLACSQRMRPRQMAVAAALGAMLAGVSALSLLVPKGAYLAHGLAAASLLACLWAAPRNPVPYAGANTAAMALWFMMAAGVASVSIHWGGPRAEVPGIGLACLLAALPLLAGATTRQVFASSVRSQVAISALLALLTLLIGVSGGGAYMAGRFDSSRQDLDGRLAHWRLSLSALQSAADGAFGLGTGRYPALYMSAGRIQDLPGDYRWLNDAQGHRLLLTGGRHVMGWGEVLRVSQRIDVPTNPARVRWRVRAPQPVTLHAEVCEKHLLYSGRCAIGKVQITQSSDQWQEFETQLLGDWPLSRGTELAPRLMVFSLALGSPGTRAEIQRVELLDHKGAQVLHNADFNAGLTSWYISSDRNHMPWHAKNLAVHLLTEQGVLGLLLWSGLAAAALFRLTRGALAHLPFAAPTAAGIVGTLVVGIADSLLDIPRLSFLIHFFIGLGATGIASAWCLPSTQKHSNPASESHRVTS